MATPRLEVGKPMPADAQAVARAKQMMTSYVATVVHPEAHPLVTPYQRIADEAGRQRGPVVAHLLIRVPVRTAKRGETGHVTFPVPALCEGQVPLAFRVVQSPGKLIGYSLRKREDQHNLICEADVQPGTKGAWVKFEALVLLGGPQPRDFKPPSESGSSWVQSTACVQSTAPEVRQVMQKLSTRGESDEQYARKVFAFVRDDKGNGGPIKTLDAVAGLRTGGYCTNKANLVAALLRAHGISARTVSHMPTWAMEPLDYHWLTEYWQPGRGWVAIDSALGRWEPDRRTRIVLSVSSPKDEDLAFNPLHERFVMPGAPYMSVAELSSKLYPADITSEPALNSGDQVACLGISRAQEADLFRVATGFFARLLHRPSGQSSDADRYKRVLEAAKGGHVDNLISAIKS